MSNSSRPNTAAAKIVSGMTEIVRTSLADCINADMTRLLRFIWYHRIRSLSVTLVTAVCFQYA